MHRRHVPLDAGTSPSLTTIRKPGFKGQAKLGNIVTRHLNKDNTIVPLIYSSLATVLTNVTQNV